MMLQEQVEAAMDYEYDPVYVYNDSVAFESTTNTFSGSYTMTEILANQAMNDMARYLGALYRQEGSTVESITFGETVYTWDVEGTLKGSNWKSEGNSLVSALVGAVVGNINDPQPLTLKLSNGEDTLDVIFDLDVEAVAVTGVSIDEADQTLEVGDTFQFNATVAPSDATNQNVTWSSSNETVATVDANGLVTAVAAGTATITVTTVDGSFTATTVVTVNMTLQEQVEAAMDYEYDPVYVYNDSVAFESTTNTFSGSYTMTEILANQAMNDMARYLGALYRQEGSTVESITFGETVYTWDVEGTLKGSNWKSEGNSLVSALVGAVVGNINDPQPLTLKLSNGEDTLDVIFDLDVEAVPVTGVTVDKTEITLVTGDTETITATVAPADATNKNVSWTSSDEAVATVADGVVTPLTAGTTNNYGDNC